MDDNGFLEYLNSPAGLVQLFLGVPTLLALLPTAWRLLSRAARWLAARVPAARRRTRIDVSPSASRPLDRVLAKPARRLAGLSAEELAAHMRLSGRVPLRRRRPRLRRPGFWSRYRLNAKRITDGAQVRLRRVAVALSALLERQRSQQPVRRRRLRARSSHASQREPSAPEALLDSDEAQGAEPDASS